MVFKKCRDNGCEQGKRDKCVNPNHPWWIQVMVNGSRERGPVSKYAALCSKDANGLPALPRTRKEAGILAGAVKLWIKAGRPAPTPTTDPTAPTSPERPTITVAGDARTIADVCKDFKKSYIPEFCPRDNGAAGIVNAISREVGSSPVMALFDREVTKTFLAKIEKRTSRVNSNRHRSKWSAMIGFVRVTYLDESTKAPLYDGPTPFYSRAANKKGIAAHVEGQRSRRLGEHATLGDREESEIRTAMGTLDDGGMMQARFDCAVDCGLRRGEMLALKLADVKWNYQGKGCHLHVRWSTSKTDYERFVPASARVERFLKTRQLIKTGFLYGQFDGAAISASQFRDDWEDVLAAAGVNQRTRGKSAKGWPVWVLTSDGDLNWHDLRHECASRLAETNIEPKVLMQIMGHLSFQTTLRYINHSAERARDAIRKVAKKYGTR